MAGLTALFVFLAFFLSSPPSSPAGERTLGIAAASDLSFALKEIAAEFEKETGVRPVISFGSTGLLSRQIEEGAPFDVFLAADTASILALSRAGRVMLGTAAIYAEGRLALVSKRGPGIKAVRIEDLSMPRIRRVAVANPAHAPYGKAAVEALQNSGVFEAVKVKLVYGENVRQALQFVETGDADAGIVALSIAGVAGVEYSEVPPSLHEPINQAAAVIAGSRNTDMAREFVRFLFAPVSRAILERHRFTPKSGNAR